MSKYLARERDSAMRLAERYREERDAARAELAQLRSTLGASDAWLRMWKAAAMDENSVERRAVDKVRLMIEERDSIAKSK